MLKYINGSEQEKNTEIIKNAGKLYQFVRAGLGKFFFELIASSII
jgi:hypothetical protein